jgi:hypothetical protein
MPDDLRNSLNDPEPSLTPERQARLDAWVKVLASAPACPPPPAGMAERALAAIHADRMKLQPSDAPLPSDAAADPLAAPFRRRWSRRLAEIGAMAVAAGLLVAVILPGLSQSRQANARVACAENLRRFGMAFATYSTGNENQLPALAMPADGNWLRAADGGARSNAANLLPLLNAKLIAASNLDCPGNPPEVAPAAASGVSGARDIRPIGYSYACLYGPARPTWNGSASMIILADKNPLFPDGPALPFKNSANHNERGNYLLHADSNVTWETSPNAGAAHDNIWTVSRGGNIVTSYRGTEVPSSAADTFLVP